MSRPVYQVEGQTLRLLDQYAERAIDSYSRWDIASMIALLERQRALIAEILAQPTTEVQP